MLIFLIVHKKKGELPCIWTWKPHWFVRGLYTRHLSIHMYVRILYIFHVPSFPFVQLLATPASSSLYSTSSRGTAIASILTQNVHPLHYRINSPGTNVQTQHTYLSHTCASTHYLSLYTSVKENLENDRKDTIYSILEPEIFSSPWQTVLTQFWSHRVRTKYTFFNLDDRAIKFVKDLVIDLFSTWVRRWFDE